MMSGERTEHEPEADDAEGGGPAVSGRPPAPGDQGLKAQVWVLGLVGIVVIMLALFSLVL